MGVGFLRISLVLCLVASNVLYAQEQEIISTHILTYSPVGVPKDFQSFYQTGGKVRQFFVSSSNLGVPVSYKGPRQFLLRGSESEFEPPKDGAKPIPPLASVRLPKGADEVLIMVIPGVDGDGIRLAAYDISSGELKKGEYRAFNFATQSIALRMGEQKFTLEPGKDRVLRDPNWPDEVVALPIHVAVNVAGKPKVVYSSFWEHYPERRAILCFFNGNQRTRPIVFSCFNALSPLPRKD